MFGMNMSWDDAHEASRGLKSGEGRYLTPTLTDIGITSSRFWADFILHQFRRDRENGPIPSVAYALVSPKTEIGLPLKR